MAKSPFKYFRVDKNILNDSLLTTAERVGYWVQLLALAKACNCNGAFIDQFDRPMSLNQIKKNAKQRKNSIDLWLTSGKLVKKDDEYVIKNWAKYQDNYDRRGDLKYEKPQNDSPTDTESRKPLTDKESRKTKGDSAGSGNVDLSIDCTPKARPTAQQLFEQERLRLLKQADELKTKQTPKGPDSEDW